MPVTLQQQFGSYVYATGNADVERWEDQLPQSPEVVTIPRSDRVRDAEGYLRLRQVSITAAEVAPLRLAMFTATFLFFTPRPNATPPALIPGWALVGSFLAPLTIAA